MIYATAVGGAGDRELCDRSQRQKPMDSAASDPGTEMALRARAPAAAPPDRLGNAGSWLRPWACVCVPIPERYVTGARGWGST